MLPNPPIPLFRSQQANDDASISQIGNPTPWNEALSQFKENLHKDLEKSLSVHFKETENAKPYPLYFDYMKFSMVEKSPTLRGEDNKTTKEHIISMFIAQLGEASTMEHMRIYNFPLSLTGTASVVFFISILPIGSWAQLEEKFQEHFYNGTSEVKLSNLILVKEGPDESVLDYVKRFSVIKN